MKWWPSSRASAWASTRTRRVGAANRSNMASANTLVETVSIPCLNPWYGDTVPKDDPADGWEAALQEWTEEFSGRGWVTLAEAEAATGVSRSALRAWFRKGELPSRVEEGRHGPQRLVELEAVIDKVA